MYSNFNKIDFGLQKIHQLTIFFLTKFMLSHKIFPLFYFLQQKN